MMQSALLHTIAVIGGTGKEGKGLAFRWAKAGYRVIIGSRSAERAAAVAAEIKQLLGDSGNVEGLSNADAAARGSIVVLTVPYAAHREILESIKAALDAKVLIDATVPFARSKDRGTPVQYSGSAAEEARDILGTGAGVAAAFHTISSELLFEDGMIDCDVLVTGTSKEARAEALSLVQGAGLEGWDAGPIENARVSEGLASVLIQINRKYGARRAGIRITGVPRP